MCEWDWDCGGNGGGDDVVIEASSAAVVRVAAGEELLLRFGRPGRFDRLSCRVRSVDGIVKSKSLISQPRFFSSKTAGEVNLISWLFVKILISPKTHRIDPSRFEAK